MSDGHEHVDVEGHKASMGSPFRTKVGGNHGAPVPAASSGLSPPPGFGIITLRTGWGLYVFATRSSRSPASHPSGPAASIVSNVIPSLPGAPPLERASA